MLARTETIHRPIDPVAYDCIKVMVVRHGSAVLFSEFGQKPVKVGDAVLLAANTLCGSQPEGHVTVSIPIAHLSDQDHEVYRAPYPTPESRLPLLQWPRSLPIEGEPAEVVSRVEAYDTWLSSSENVPKLMPVFRDGPGLMGPAVHDWIVAHAANLELADCGVAGHHAPEDQPEAIADAIGGWLRRHGLVRATA